MVLKDSFIIPNISTKRKITKSKPNLYLLTLNWQLVRIFKHFTKILAITHRIPKIIGNLGEKVTYQCQ